jgi:hypothetical protein
MRYAPFASLVAFAALTVAAPAQAEDAKAEKAEDKIICKGERSLEFGSHRRAKKVCMTESEWELLEKGTQRELQAFRERSQTRGDNRGR